MLIEAEAEWDRGVESGAEQEGEYIRAEVAYVGTLEGQVLRLEPSDEGSDSCLFSGVAATLDGARDRASEAPGFGGLDQVDTEGADGEQGRSGGHKGEAVRGGPRW